MLNAPRLTRITPTTAQPIIFTGGLNEEFPNLDMKGGELSDVMNYVERDGSINGYASLQGYERFDGQPSPSGVQLNIDPVDGSVIDDIAREAARALITAIPGSGRTRGVHIYNTNKYGFRNDATSTNIEMYRATATGWSKITAGTGAAGGNVESITARFSLYNTNLPTMFWVDGVSPLHAYNDTTVSTIAHASLPAGVYPTHIGEWNNRMFLAYAGGHIFFSAVGDPTDYAAGSGAGEIYIGDDVTGFTVTPGGQFLITMKDSIEFLEDTGSTSTLFVFSKKTFSATSGAISGTVKRMLGTVYFADDRGVTTLAAAQEYGDFVANSLAKKVEKTYQANKGKIVLATTNRQDNQYILFFNGPASAEGLVFSFKGKRLKGATKIKLNHLVYNIAEGKDDDRNSETYFGSDDGFVFKLYTGTSFDGGAIETRMATSFYHYNSPTRWKFFKEIMVEVSGDANTELTHREEYDYEEPYFPTAQSETTTTGSNGGVWGVSLWNAFTWGGSSLSRIKDKIVGYGTNMRLLLVSSSKYKNPHSLHNMIVQYTSGATRN